MHLWLLSWGYLGLRLNVSALNKLFYDDEDHDKAQYFSE
jgi:hypothetical protein